MFGLWSFSINVVLDDPLFITNDNSLQKKDRSRYVWNVYRKYWSFVLSEFLSEPKYSATYRVQDVLCDFKLLYVTD